MVVKTVESRKVVCVARTSKDEKRVMIASSYAAEEENGDLLE
jgi:hypothetical protein